MLVDRPCGHAVTLRRGPDVAPGASRACPWSLRSPVAWPPSACRRSGAGPESARCSTGCWRRPHGARARSSSSGARRASGKTALLRYCARQASGFRVVQIAGVESEMELPYAGLHQLCAPMLDQLDAPPEPQQDALRVAFGLSLGRRSRTASWSRWRPSACWPQAAEERPLLCLVDDAQWLDGASGQVARLRGAPPAGRVGGDRVRRPRAERRAAARRACRSCRSEASPTRTPVRCSRRSSRVDSTSASATGSSPRPAAIRWRCSSCRAGMSAAELAGGSRFPDAGDLPDQIEEHYLRRLGDLPEATQRLMLLAAADPVGDAPLVWRAAEALGIGREAAAPAAGEQLLEIGARVRFRHPLVRSAVYRSASPQPIGGPRTARSPTPPTRRPTPIAGPGIAPRRRSGPTTRSRPSSSARPVGRRHAAGSPPRPRSWSGRPSLTADPARRRRSGCWRRRRPTCMPVRSTRPSRCWPRRNPGRSDELGRAHVDLFRGRVASASSAGSEARPAALEGGPAPRAARPGACPRDLSRRVGRGAVRRPPGRRRRPCSRSPERREPPPPRHEPRPSDLLLDGLAALVIEGRAAAAPMLRRAVRAFRDDEVSVEQWLQWGVLASSAAVDPLGLRELGRGELPPDRARP